MGDFLATTMGGENIVRQSAWAVYDPKELEVKLKEIAGGGKLINLGT